MNSNADGDGGWGRRPHRGSGLTLTPAAGAKRGASDEEFGGRRRYGPDGRRAGDRDDNDDTQRDPEQAKKYKSRLEDWILAVNLLLNWDDQKTISAAEMDENLTKFLEADAKSKYRITPRLTSEIFLRGILRTLWDIDRLLRFMNPGEELKMVTAKSPMVLSILRVMAYEFMWTPNCTPKGACQGARDLMERVSVAVKADREWITNAMVRMGEAFEKVHNAWDRKHAAAKEKKRREREQQAARAAGSGDIAAGGAKLKLAENAKAAKVAGAQAKRKRGADDARGKRKGADAHFGNARALAVKEQALAGKVDQSADSQKPTRTAVVRPAAAQDDGDEEEEGEEGAQREAPEEDEGEPGDQDEAEAEGDPADRGDEGDQGDQETAAADAEEGDAGIADAEEPKAEESVEGDAGAEAAGEQDVDPAPDVEEAPQGTEAMNSGVDGPAPEAGKTAAKEQSYPKLVD